VTHPGRRRLAAAALACAVAALLAPRSFAGDWKLEPFRLRNKQADFELKMVGYGQLDFRSFPGWQVEESLFRNDRFDIRRVRVGVEGKWKKLSWDFTYELVGPIQDLVRNLDPTRQEAAELKNLYAEYEFTNAFALRVGHTKPPVSPEFLTSASRTDFVERSMLSNALAPDRDWGVMALGKVAKRLDYSVGVFVGDGNFSDNRSEAMVAARLVLEAAKGLDVGGSFAHSKMEPEPDTGDLDPSPKGFLGRSPTFWRFYERKFVEGRRLRWGADAQYFRGPVGLKGEFLQGREQRKRQGSVFQDLPDEVGSGWSATASWVLTGEKKERSLKPKRPLTKGGPGLIELVARYESLRFDDTGPSGGFEGAGNRASNLRPAQDRIMWAGLSWWPSEWMRLQANATFERYLDALLAPEPPGARFVTGTPKGRGTYTSLFARVQFMFP
jgi:phosphate-selective porin